MHCIYSVVVAAHVQIMRSKISVREGETIKLVCTSRDEDDVEWRHNSVDVDFLRINDSRYTHHPSTTAPMPPR